VVKIDHNNSGNVFTILGSDEGMLRENALKIWNQLTNGNDDGFTHETIDGIAANADEALTICCRTIEALQTLSMFGGDKVVWLKNVNFLAEDRTSSSESATQGIEMIRSTLEAGLSKGQSFILSAAKIDKRKSFWKFLEKNSTVQIFDKIDTSSDGWQDEVAELVINRATKIGLTFEQEALELFIMLAGEATNQISNELEKLDLYLGDRRKITEDDIKKMVPLSRAGVIFEIGRAIQNTDVARAIQLIDEQLEQGESAVAIIRASIIPTIRNLFMARILIDQTKASAHSYRDFESAVNRISPSERAWLPQKKSGGGVNVYPLFLSAKGALQFSSEALEKILHATAAADKTLVTRGLDERFVLHKLITEIAAAALANKQQSRSA
jgi:DNA polymerase III subunit delta